MDLMYSSTRNGQVKFTASQAILKGLADDGGLFVPETIPALDVSIDELANMTYQETAYEVMKQFFTDFTEEELKNCINKAYDSKFDTKRDCTTCRCRRCILSGVIPRTNNCIQRYGVIHSATSSDYIRKKESRKE